MISKLLKSSLLLLFFISMNSKAQTAVNLSYVADSSANWQHCPPPVPVDLILYGDATGYNDVTDSIDIHVFWGDGTDTLFTTDLVNGGTTDYFQVWGGISHNYLMAGNFNMMVVATGVNGVSDTMTYGPFTVYSGCVTVDGDCYVDNNANCVFDAGDDTLQGIPLWIHDGTGNWINYAYTDQNGHYSCGVPVGLSNLIIEPQSNYYMSFLSTTCPVAGNYVFNSSANMTFNFGFNCGTSGHDLTIMHSSTNAAAPGSAGWLYLYGYNFSCLPVNGVITLTLPADITYTGTFYGPAPTSVVGNVLTWNHNFNAANYYWNNMFYVGISTLTSPTATLFDSVCFTATIDPIAGDMNAADNSDTWCRVIGGPYDPNSKEVVPAGLGTAGNVAPQTEFNYKINFQNTGTAPAINVYLMDTISSNLDMATFHITGASHFMNPSFNNTNIVRFDFPNINLPDSNANEAMSHGWVTYTIKAKNGLANGTQIKNTGHIYFDYNPAIVTNTTLNTIDIALGVNNETKNTVGNSIFPNPASNTVLIKFDAKTSGNLNIADVTGKIVKTISVNKADQVQISVADLADGIYCIILPGVQLSQNRIQVIH